MNKRHTWWHICQCTVRKNDDVCVESTVKFFISTKNKYEFNKKRVLSIANQKATHRLFLPFKNKQNSILLDSEMKMFFILTVLYYSHSKN